MQVSCPLPIDWLDFLEGDRSAASPGHLDQCPSCREVVSILKARLDQVPRVTGWTEGIDLHATKPWPEKRLPEARQGEIWLSATSFLEGSFGYRDQNRLPLLVLNHRDRPDGRWLEVVPVWTDVENASSNDLLLNSDETTLGAQFRAIFRWQGMVAERQLDNAIGKLTTAGEKKLETVLGGRFSNADFGVRRIEEAETETAEWIPRTAGLIESFYLHSREKHSPREQVTAEKLSPHGEFLSELIGFHLRDVELTNEDLSLPFAAQTTFATREREATFETAERKLVGYLRHELFRDDQLVLRVTETYGFARPIRVRLKTGSQETLLSAEFVPESGLEFILTEGSNLFLDDIVRVELVEP